MAGEDNAVVGITIVGDAQSVGGEFRKVKGEARVAGKAVAKDMGKAFDRIEKDATKAGRTIRDRVGGALRAVKEAGAQTANMLGGASAAALAAGAAIKALGDENRLRLIHLLALEELSVGELVEVLNLGQSRISAHLALLKDNKQVEDAARPFSEN